MTFTLTPDTDPSTIMFEGLPDIKIIAIGDRIYECNQGRIAVFFEMGDGLPESLWDAGFVELTDARAKSIRGVVTNRTHLSAFFNHNGTPSVSRNSDKLVSTLPRIVERVTPVLTKDTDPSTIMFEGHPEVTIASIEPNYGIVGEREFFIRIGTFPLGTKFGETELRGGYNHLHNADGKDVSGRFGNVWPTIIKRIAVDPAKPLAVRYIDPMRSCGTQADLDRRGYRVVGRVVPIDSDEPTRLLIKRGRDNSSTLVVDPITGRVVEGNWGRNLQFYNPPEPTTLELQTALVSDALILLDTVVDTVITENHVLVRLGDNTQFTVTISPA
jgi:hypothetical protein